VDIGKPAISWGSQQFRKKSIHRLSMEEKLRERDMALSSLFLNTQVPIHEICLKMK
jgi:hypothetical protein